MTKSQFLWKLTTLWRIAYFSRPGSSRLGNSQCLEVICKACTTFRERMFVVLIKMWPKSTAGKEDYPKSQIQSPWRKMKNCDLVEEQGLRLPSGKLTLQSRQEASLFLLKSRCVCLSANSIPFSLSHVALFSKLIVTATSWWWKTKETKTGLFENSAYVSSNFWIVEKISCVNG